MASSSKEAPTRVVNVKVAYIRPAYSDLRAWCADPNNVYIGRGGVVFVSTSEGGKVRYPPTPSKWHNPFKVKDHGLEKCPALYENYIRQVPFLEEIEELKGKTLGCWCVVPISGTKQSEGCVVPGTGTKQSESPVCHGQILVKILQERQALLK